MILLYLILILLAGGVLSWAVAKGSPKASRWIAFLAPLIDFVIVVGLWIQHPMGLGDLTEKGNWLVDYQLNWIPSIGASIHFAMDGLSLVMAALTLFVGALATLTGWKEIKHRLGFYHFNLLVLLAGILGVFLAVDLLLFYFFWEVMIVPMFFLIAIWGYEKRKHASRKFFIFTQISGLMMLLAILGLYFVHAGQTGEFSFDYFDLVGTSMPANLAFWLMCGFLVAFCVKLPALIFHGWLPDAYTHAPTAGSIIVAGLMTKTAAYGMLRFILPLFPDAAATIAPYMMALGAVGILYGAKLAYAQKDFKRLIAFSSLSHMGFIVLGVFAMNTLAYQGTIMEMVVHGISISALFVIAGALRDRTGVRDMSQMGRFWEKMPGMGGITLVFVMCSLGLPGLGNFIAEFLVLAGAFQVSILWSVLATIGLISSMIYSLKIMQKIYYGKRHSSAKLYDFTGREYFIMGAFIVAIVWLGFFPQKIVDTVKPVVQQIEQRVQHPVQTAQVNVLNLFKNKNKQC